MKKFIYLLIPLSLIIIFFIIKDIPQIEIFKDEKGKEESIVEEGENTEDKFSSCSDGNGVVNGILTDSRDNQTYTTVQIGEQCWISQNLNYDNGCSDVVWVDDSREGWCGCYDNDPDNCEKYGLLYQWTAAMDNASSESAQGLCPNGWHIPSDGEWKTLEMFLGMTQEEADAEGSERNGGVVKSKLKDPNHKEYSGFNALAGGRRVGDGQFKDIKSVAYFVTSSATKVDNAWRRYIDWYIPGIDRRATFQGHSFSVRCVRD